MINIQPLAALHYGLVNPVGNSAAAACAAMRLRLSAASESNFVDSAGEWIIVNQVAQARATSGLNKLAQMAATSIDEALSPVPRNEWPLIPLLLCVAERNRPGRTPGLEDALAGMIETLLDTRFAPGSSILPHGRASMPVALAQARKLIAENQARRVLIAAADSLINWATLSHYESNDRLLTANNSNGFLPGEGAGAVLVGAPHTRAALACAGLGFSVEPAPFDSALPLRAEGLTRAIEGALAEAGVKMHDIDCRIADMSGEQYYFKEAALAVSRTLRERRAEQDLWHPAESIGECGAAIGPAMLVLADAACRQGRLGTHTLLNFGTDDGQRAALVLQYGKQHVG